MLPTLVVFSDTALTFSSGHIIFHFQWCLGVDLAPISFPIPSRSHLKKLSPPSSVPSPLENITAVLRCPHSITIPILSPATDLELTSDCC